LYDVKTNLIWQWAMSKLTLFGNGRFIINIETFSNLNHILKYESDIKRHKQWS